MCVCVYECVGQFIGSCVLMVNTNGSIVYMSLYVYFPNLCSSAVNILQFLFLIYDNFKFIHSHFKYRNSKQVLYVFWKQG